MASSDNTALKVSLVVLGVITLGVLVAFIMQLEKVDELGKQAEQAKADSSAAKRSEETMKQQYSELREMLTGTGKGPEDHKAVKTALEEVMNKPNLSNDRMTRTRGRYTTVEEAIKYLQNELGSSDKNLTEIQKKANELEATLKKSRDEVNKEIQQYQAKLVAANEDLKNERNAFNDKVGEKDRTIEKIQAQLQTYRGEMEQLTRDVNKEKDSFKSITFKLQQQVAELKTENTKLATVIFGSKESGKIESVEEGGTVATVNVGAVDGLRTGQIFGIYGRDTGGNPLQLPKANLEIFKIVGPHTAKGRITDYKINQPVLDNDLIYSAIWSPGTYEGIALAGLIYLDDDNEQDLDAFRKLITQNGGKLDAYVDPKTGKIVGELSPKTRWLVLGEPMEMVEGVPEDESDVKRRAEFAKNTLALKDFARQAGVTPIQMENFKKYIGYNAPYNSIPVGQERRTLKNRYVPPKGKFETQEKKESKRSAGVSN